MENTFFINNRNKITEMMSDYSATVLFSGESPVMGGDRLYDFYVNRNFYYAVGIDRENMIFTAVKTGDSVLFTLYIPRLNEQTARWVGANMTADEAKDASGITDIRFIDEFDNGVADMVYRHNATEIYIDTDNRFNRTELTKGLAFAKKIKRGYPHLNILSANGMLADLREIKSGEEVTAIKNGIEITKEGIYTMMKNARPGMTEYELEAYFDFTLKKYGIKHPAFNTIAAGGKNAAILHYEGNNSVVNDGEMILFDLGAVWNNYSADITRTFPVNGKFTEVQKDFYNMVLKGQQMVIDMIKPGLPFGDMNKALREYYLEEMKKRGFADTDEELSKYYFHSVSHHLGLETHDAGTRTGKLKQGMVITVEPGIYIEELGIGIRIEDDVLVTENGCEVLSKDIIKTVEDIEKLMAEE